SATPPSWTRSPRGFPMPRSRPSPPGTRRGRERAIMQAPMATRRDVVKSAAAAGAAALLARPAIAQGAPRVLVVGGGCAGAGAARALESLDPRFAGTMVEASRTFPACPFSNGVIAGLRDISAQQFTYEKTAADRVVIAFATAVAVDPQARTVALS